MITTTKALLSLIYGIRDSIDVQESKLIYLSTLARHLIISFLIASYLLIPRDVKSSPLIPLRQDEQDSRYAIIIDAGSSGSRIFAYEYKFHGANRAVDDLDIDIARDSDTGEPLVRKISPGLSSFSNNATQAAEYLFELIDFVLPRLRGPALSPHPPHPPKIPLFIMATAGMRLLSTEARRSILDDCRRDIAARYRDQLIFAPRSAQVISGKTEGIYAWIAINYIRGNFASTSKTDVTNGEGTVGVLDMGGASLQVAFQVPWNYTPPASHPSGSSDHVTQVGELLEEIDLGGGAAIASSSNPTPARSTARRYKVYVSTFLGYGANEAIERYQRALVSSSQGNDTQPLLDPCFPNGFSYNLTSEELSGDAPTLARDAPSVKLLGTGNFYACIALLKPLLNLTAPCIVPPCSLNGVHQPPLQFERLKFFGFSEFWYTAHDVLGLGGAYNSSRFSAHASAFCAKPFDSSLLRSAAVRSRAYPNADVSRIVTQCIKSAWLHVVLHEGFRFPRTQIGNESALESVSLIGGKEAHWTLGALVVALVGGTARSRDAFGHIHDDVPKNGSTPRRIAVSALAPVYPVQHLYLPDPAPPLSADEAIIDHITTQPPPTRVVVVVEDPSSRSLPNVPLLLLALCALGLALFALVGGARRTLVKLLCACRPSPSRPTKYYRTLDDLSSSCPSTRNHAITQYVATLLPPWARNGGGGKKRRTPPLSSRHAATANRYIALPFGEDES